MAKKIIKAQMKQRQDTKANWAAANPVLLDGELGMVSDDRNLYKVGDGRTAWNDLPFRGFDGTLAQELGTSANAAISQKAVTEKLTELSAETIKANDNEMPLGDAYQVVTTSLKKGMIIESIGTTSMLILRKEDETEHRITTSDLPYTLPFNVVAVVPISNASGSNVVVKNLLDSKLHTLSVDLQNEITNLDKRLLEDIAEVESKISEDIAEVSAETIKANDTEIPLGDAYQQVPTSLKAGMVVESIGSTPLLILRKEDGTEHRITTSDLPYTLPYDVVVIVPTANASGSNVIVKNLIDSKLRVLSLEFQEEIEELDARVQQTKIDAEWAIGLSSYNVPSNKELLVNKHFSQGETILLATDASNIGSITLGGYIEEGGTEDLVRGVGANEIITITFQKNYTKLYLFSGIGGIASIYSVSSIKGQIQELHDKDMELDAEIQNVKQNVATFNDTEIPLGDAYQVVPTSLKKGMIIESIGSTSMLILRKEDETEHRITTSDLPYTLPFNVVAIVPISNASGSNVVVKNLLDSKLHALSEDLQNKITTLDERLLEDIAEVESKISEGIAEVSAETSARFSESAESTSKQIQALEDKTDVKFSNVANEIGNIKPIINQGTINNAADEEDLTSENNLLKLKDRSALNGMGYVILRKNKSFAAQVTEENTIYEVRYQYDLNGATFTMPKNCVLNFVGGQISNGTLVGNSTEISGVTTNILNNVVLTQTYTNLSCNITWWGANNTKGFDNSEIIDNAFRSSIPVIEVSGRYYISKPIELPYNKVIKGRTGNNNQLTGFYANENFASKSVDFPARYGKDAFSQEVKGMFYHRDTTKCEMHDVFVDARHYADFCIEHIDLYGSIDMYNCYIGGANKVGLLQYACENPVYDQLYIVDCHIGMIISTNKFTDGNPLEKAFYEGTSMGMPNIVSGKNIRTMFCNYGFIINGGSDFKIDSLETAHNSIIGAIVRNCYGELNKYYSEGDGRCNFYINGLEKEEAADGYALQSIVDNNLDGVATTSVPVKGKSVYVRGACLFWDSTITLTSAFLSVKPRSYVSVDAESYEWMDNREPQGVDCGIINYNSILVADTIRIYLAPNNLYRNALYSVVISLGQRCGDQVSIRFCDNRAIKNIIAPINSLDFAGGDTKMIINQHSVQMSNKLDLNWNIENSRRDFSYQSKDERSCKYYGMYNNRPLYFNGIPMTKPIWFTKEQLDNLADSKFCKVVMLVKVLNTTSIRPKISVMWSDKQYKIVYELGNNNSSAKELEPGEYWLTAFFPTKVSFEYANCAITASVAENEDYVVSHLYIYLAEDGESAPHNFTSVLFNRGYTSQRPTISFEGQEYYDIDLHKMIYANSSLNGWVDATGASV